jgi:hypothetical protein
MLQIKSKDNSFPAQFFTIFQNLGRGFSWNFIRNGVSEAVLISNRKLLYVTVCCTSGRELQFIVLLMMGVENTRNM